jgi:ornithine decarboxylase
VLSHSKFIENFIEQEQDGDAFYIGNLSVMETLYNQWIDLMPRVEPFYAIKCNPNPDLVEYLAKLPRIGFDCASTAEIALALNLGMPQSTIIFANPCKGIAHLKFARESGVKMMTFDNEAELRKIKDVFPESDLIIRIRVEEFGSVCSFKEKFGAGLKDAEKLLRIAKDLSLNVIGVSFHVGSGCKSPSAFYNAIKDCRALFNFAKDELDYRFEILDLGGGFSDIGKRTDGDTLFERICATIKEALDIYFPEEDNEDYSIRIIAEPGRYFAQRVFSLAVSVTSKKLLSNDSQVFSTDESSVQVEKIMYYINEGLYSGFNCVIFDHQEAKPSAVFTQGKLQVLDESDERVYKSVVWGPTCDGFDCVSRELELPQLDVGDWIVFHNFGAYTMAAATNFNGFKYARIHWVS